MSRFDRSRGKTAPARRLRQNAVKAEQKLYVRLQGGRLDEFAFPRRHPVGRYVLDFYCPADRPAIEPNGNQHATAVPLAHNAARVLIAQNGIRVLRSKNLELRENFEGSAGHNPLPIDPTRPASPLRLRRAVPPFEGGENVEQ
jgi:very-short-patch-repair endonuclease